MCYLLHILAIKAIPNTMPLTYRQKTDRVNVPLKIRLQADNPCSAAPGSPRRTRRRLPGVPGSKKKKKIFFFQNV